MTTYQQDVAALAAKVGVDASVVDAMVKQVAGTMGEEMLKAETEAEQVELAAAGVEHSRRVMRNMASAAMTRHGEFCGVVYDMLKEREK